MTLVNLPHASFTVRLYSTVKEVRLHSERGKAIVVGVVGTVAAMPYRSMGSQRTSCRGYGHRALEAWLQDGGSGEAVLAPEPKRGQARRNLRPRPRGRSRRNPHLSPGDHGWFALSPLFDFYFSDLGIPFYGTQQRYILKRCKF